MPEGKIPAVMLVVEVWEPAPAGVASAAGTSPAASRGEALPVLMQHNPVIDQNPVTKETCQLV